jgi:hypothetical protein
MPGNLEALPILPEHAYGVKKKLGRNPYPTRVSGSATCRAAERPAATKPGSRAPKAAKRTLDTGARNPPDQSQQSTQAPATAGAVQAAGNPTS